MGMMLSLKDDDVFNSVVAMDTVHNSLVATVRVANAERRALSEKLDAEYAEGEVVGGTLTRDQALKLRPRMIEVNTLVEAVRTQAGTAFKESGEAMDGLHKLLRDKVGISYTLEPVGPRVPKGDVEPDRQP